MFEVGKRYTFHRIINGDETTMGGIVESYNHPMLKLADTDLTGSRFAPASGSPLVRGEVINVTSPHFISAKLAE